MAPEEIMACGKRVWPLWLRASMGEVLMPMRNRKQSGALVWELLVVVTIILVLSFIVFAWVSSVEHDPVH